MRLTGLLSRQSRSMFTTTTTNDDNKEKRRHHHHHRHHHHRHHRNNSQGDNINQKTPPDYHQFTNGNSNRNRYNQTKSRSPSANDYHRYGESPMRSRSPSAMSPRVTSTTSLNTSSNQNSINNNSTTSSSGQNLKLPYPVLNDKRELSIIQSILSEKQRHLNEMLEQTMIKLTKYQNDSQTNDQHEQQQRLFRLKQLEDNIKMQLNRLNRQLDYVKFSLELARMTKHSSIVDPNTERIMNDLNKQVQSLFNFMKDSNDRFIKQQQQPINDTRSNLDQTPQTTITTTTPTQSNSTHFESASNYNNTTSQSSQNFNYYRNIPPPPMVPPNQIVNVTNGQSNSPINQFISQQSPSKFPSHYNSHHNPPLPPLPSASHHHSMGQFNNKIHSSPRTPPTPPLPPPQFNSNVNRNSNFPNNRTPPHPSTGNKIKTPPIMPPNQNFNKQRGKFSLFE
jgi:hypothetical protein